MSEINLTIKLMDNCTIKRILSLNCTILDIKTFNTMIISEPALGTNKNTFAYRNNLYQIPNSTSNNPNIYPKLHKFDGNMHIIIPFANSLEDIYLRLNNQNIKSNFPINAEHIVDSQIELTNILNHYKLYADYSANTQQTAKRTTKPIKIKVNDIDINDFLQKEKTKLYKQFIRLKKYSYMGHKNEYLIRKLKRLDKKIDDLYNYIDSEGYHLPDMFKDF